MLALGSEKGGRCPLVNHGCKNSLLTHLVRQSRQALTPSYALRTTHSSPRQGGVACLNWRCARRELLAKAAHMHPTPPRVGHSHFYRHLTDRLRLSPGHSTAYLLMLVLQLGVTQAWPGLCRGFCNPLLHSSWLTALGLRGAYPPAPRTVLFWFDLQVLTSRTQLTPEQHNFLAHLQISFPRNH